MNLVPLSFAAGVMQNPVTGAYFIAMVTDADRDDTPNSVELTLVSFN